MTQEPNELKKELDIIRRLIEDTQDKLDGIRDEILEAITETEKVLIAKNAEIDTYQRAVLEKNQQLIWHEGIGKIIEILEEATAKPEQEPEEE